MDTRVKRAIALQCILAIVVIVAFIGLMGISGTFAQWPSFSGGYSYPGGFYGGYSGYGYPGSSYSAYPYPYPYAYPYIGDGNYSRYVSLGGFLVPREIFELSASSNWDTSQLGGALIKPYIQSAITSGYPGSIYGGYSGYGYSGGLYSGYPGYGLYGGYSGVPYSGFYGSGLGNPIPDPRFPGSGLVIPPPVIWITPTEGYNPFTGARVMS